MSTNPYEAPVAETTDLTDPAHGAGYTGEIARRPAADGVAWISDGWKMFKSQPGTWTLITLVFSLLLVAVNLIPLIGGLLWYVLFPILGGGLMVACDAVRRGEPPTVGQLFNGFNRQTGQLALIGVIYLGVLIAVMLIFAVIGVMLAPTLGLDFTAFLGEGGDAGTITLAVTLILLAVLAISIPLLMSVWFAPALVILLEMPAFEAMKRSFLGCLANIVPFLIYGVVSLFLSLLATLPLLLGWLVVGPIFIGSVYSGYRRIYFSS